MHFFFLEKEEEEEVLMSCFDKAEALADNWEQRWIAFSEFPLFESG